MHVLCRWGEGGPPIELEAFPCSVFPSAGVTNVCEAENLPLIVWDKECMQEMCSLVWGLSSPSSRLSTIDIDVIQVIKWTRPFHSVSAYCRLDSGKVWEQGYIKICPWMRKLNSSTMGVGVFLRGYSIVNT